MLVDKDETVISYGAGVIGQDVLFNNNVLMGLDGLSQKLLPAMGAVAFMGNKYTDELFHPYARKTLTRDIDSVDELYFIVQSWLTNPDKLAGLSAPSTDTIAEMEQFQIMNNYVKLNNALALVTNLAMLMGVNDDETIMVPKFKDLVKQMNLPMGQMEESLAYLSKEENLKYMLYYDDIVDVSQEELGAREYLVEWHSSLWSLVADQLKDWALDIYELEEN